MATAKKTKEVKETKKTVEKKATKPKASKPKASKKKEPEVKASAESIPSPVPTPTVTPPAPVPNPYDGPEEAIVPELATFLAEKLRKDLSVITPSVHFRKDLQADSLDLVEMVVFMEEKFALSVADEDLKFLATPLNVQNYLKSKGIFNQ